MKTPFFVLVDGPSGSGKDTLVAELIKKLEPNFYASFEETKMYDSARILEAREAAKLKGESGDKASAETLIEERKKIYEDAIIPEINKNKLVIANRGETTTLAYQTTNDELSMENVWDMHRKAGIPTPNLVILTMCSPETAVEREQQRKSELENDPTKLQGKFTNDTSLSLEQQLEKRRKIHEQYKKLADFLESKDIPVLILNTDELSLEKEVARTQAAIQLLSME